MTVVGWTWLCIIRSSQSYPRTFCISSHMLHITETINIFKNTFTFLGKKMLYRILVSLSSSCMFGGWEVTMSAQVSRFNSHPSRFFPSCRHSESTEYKMLHTFRDSKTYPTQHPFCSATPLLCGPAIRTRTSLHETCLLVLGCRAW